MVAQLAERWGQKIANVNGEEEIFCIEPTRAAETEQKSIVPTRQAPRTNQGRTLFHLYSLSPHLPQFQQSAESTHSAISSLSGHITREENLDPCLASKMTSCLQGDLFLSIFTYDLRLISLRKRFLTSCLASMVASCLSSRVTSSLAYSIYLWLEIHLSQEENLDLVLGL